MIGIFLVELYVASTFSIDADVMNLEKCTSLRLLSLIGTILNILVLPYNLRG